MINAKEANKLAKVNRKTKIHFISARKICNLLPVNRNKLYFIPLPFKTTVVESAIQKAIKEGLNYLKINNEITLESEKMLIDNEYKLKYYKNFIKISW